MNRIIIQSLKRNLILPGAVVFLIALGWYMVLRQTEILTQTTITAYQQTELEIVHVLARSIEAYVQEQVEVHKRTDAGAIEQEIFQRFIAPVRLLENGDAWIYAPDHVVFDLSSDFPEMYRGKNMAQIFALQTRSGASHYEEMTEAVMNAREGVGWYIWLPDKGQEIAAWTPVTVADLTWTIGLSTPLPEILASTGATDQIYTSIMVMAFGTITGVILLIAWVRSTIETAQVTQALQKSEVRYRGIVEDQTELICRFLGNGTLTFVNKAFDHYFGQNRHEWMGQSFFSFITAEDRASLKQHLTSLSREKPTLTTEYQVTTNDEIYWQRWTLRAIFDPQGHLSEFQGVGRDITASKRAEAALAEEHHLLRTLIDNIPDAIYIKDVESRFLLGNKTIAHLMTTTPNQLIGQTDFDFYPEEVARQYYADEQAIIQSGQALISKEEPHVNRAGHQIWLSTTKVPFLDSQGKIKGIVSISRDMTQRKQMEQAIQRANDELEARVEQRTAELKRVNEQLAALYQVGQIITAPLQLDAVLETIARSTANLLNTDTGAILLLDEAGETLTIKGAFGLSSQVVQGTHDRVGESIAGRVVQTGQPLIANDLPNDARFYNPAAAKEGLLACASVPLVVGTKIIGTLDVHSKIECYAFTEAHIEILKMLASQAAIAIENARLYEQLKQARDQLEERVQQRTAELVATNEQLHQEITERKRIETEREALIRELEAKNTELERFTYTVSHDLKSPLITIQGFLGFLEEDAHQGNLERFQSDLARITQATDKMQQLLNELLELSRLGRIVKPFETIALDELVSEAISLVAGRLAARGVEAIVAPNLPVVYGDRSRLRAVLQNLIDNAVKYMGNQSRPHVEIGVRPDDGGSVFYVRDNGIGIDPDDQDKIFGLFTKLDPAAEGTGMGLAIAKRIVEIHGGRLWVESEGTGRGSTFCFTLPNNPELER